MQGDGLKFTGVLPEGHKMNRRLFFEGQALHFISLLLLLWLLRLAAEAESAGTGSLWGVGAPAWLRIAVWSAVAHQVYVWLCWRAELYGGLFTRLFGGRGFLVYAVPFALIGLVRFAAVFILAASNEGALALPPAILKTLAAALLPPFLYTIYSTARYFPVSRALGADHFFERYRGAPLVREGIFKYSTNAMYLYGFLILWSAALWHGSMAALAAAAFNHVYIWVHYYCTELPDIRKIYGPQGHNRNNSQ